MDTFSCFNPAYLVSLVIEECKKLSELETVLMLYVMNNNQNRNIIRKLLEL